MAIFGHLYPLLSLRPVTKRIPVPSGLSPRMGNIWAPVSSTVPLVCYKDDTGSFWSLAKYGQYLGTCILHSPFGRQQRGHLSLPVALQRRAILGHLYPPRSLRPVTERTPVRPLRSFPVSGRLWQHPVVHSGQRTKTQGLHKNRLQTFVL